jgi:ribosomal protein S18 acetylase RimI-like enzyme
MATITAPLNSPQSGPLRPLNILRDLPQVADLIELCFSSMLDEDGQSYLQQMRRASRDNNFLRWAGQVVDSASLPLTGFVWEEDGKIVGNASLVPQHYRGRKISLIANIATHPDYRRRGIGRALTERAMQSAWGKNSKSIWLHVREDNPTAIKIYADLGFVERARRTTYHSSPNPLLAQTQNGVTVSRPSGRDWTLQREWLRRAHPDELGWYVHWDWDGFGPGLWKWLYRSLVDADTRQWAGFKDGRLLAVASWMPTTRASDMLWLATGPDGDASGVRSVLEAARRELVHYKRLKVEFPAGEMAAAIQSAGFIPVRTLIWMAAENATF